jgi:tetratricopeptide (TPR) repeat protein
MPKILVTYVFLIFFPFHLYMERITPIIRSIFGAQAVLYIALLAALAALYAFSYRRSKQLFFFASFFLVTLLPVVNILVINAPMAEHWLYLPSVGAYAVISACLSRILSRKGRASKAAAFILIIFLAFFCVRTVMRNIEWGRPFEFYRRLLKYTPDSYRGHNNLGALYLSEKDLKSAKEEFDLALRLKPDDSHTLYILGRIAMEGGDEKEALRNWKKCLDAGPFYRPGQEAVKSYLVAHDRRFRRALRAAMENPGSIRANYRLSKIYINHGLYIDALYRLENVLEADPKYANALFNRAWIYSKLSMWQKAIAGYKELMTLTPKDPDLYANLSYCYKAAKQLKEAQTMWDKAASLGYKKDR